MPMSALSTDEVLRLAKLANLTLTNEEINSIKSELSEILNYFQNLKKLRTDDVTGTSQTTGLEDVLRPDEINTLSILDAKEATSGTDNIHNNSFVVPQVIDKEQ